MKSFVTRIGGRIVRPELLGARNGLLSVRAISSSYTEDDDKKEAPFSANIRIPEHHDIQQYLEDAKRMVKENTFFNPKEIFSIANNPKPIIPDFERFNTALAGKLVRLEEGAEGARASIHAVPPLELERVRALKGVVFAGLDSADDERGIVSGIRGFGKMLGIPKERQESDIAAFYPKEQRDRRYKDGLFYFVNENFTTSWAEQFVADYIVPRLVDDNGELLPAEQVKPLLLLGYSLGAREAIMVENATLDLLQNVFGKTDDELIPYTDKFLRLGVGHAVNWENLARPHTFYAISVVSAKDMGIRRLQSFMNGAFGDGKFADQPTTIKFHAAANNSSIREFLVILRDMPPYVEKNGKKQLNRLGHGYGHYMKEIESSGQTFTEIVKKFMLGQANKLIAPLIQEGGAFEPTQRITTEALEKLLTAWSGYNFNQDVLERGKAGIVSSNLCNNAEKWDSMFAKNGTSGPWTNRLKKTNSPDRTP